MGYRLWALWGFGCAAGAMGFALYVQYGLGLEPCPMCVFQRVAMIAGAIPFLLAALHAPGGAGRWVYSGLAVAGHGAGALIAGRHVWLQSLPADQVPACGPALDYLLDLMPLAEVVQTVLRGDGNCAVIDWSFLGLSLPGWTLIGFIALCLWALANPWLPDRLFSKD